MLRCAPLFLLLLPTVAMADITGTVSKVIDGDTFELCGSEGCQKIRLCGIDAPEEGDLGYQTAKDALKALVYGVEVACSRATDVKPICNSRNKSRDRLVAACGIDGSDIGAQLMLQGVACRWEKYAGPLYDVVGEPCDK